MAYIQWGVLLFGQRYLNEELTEMVKSWVVIEKDDQVVNELAKEALDMQKILKMRWKMRQK